MARSDLLDGRTSSAPPFLNEFAGHAPYHGGGFRLGDRSAAVFEESCHRVRAVVPHSGHQHTH